MADTYDPPEAKIQQIIERTNGDPRTLAIAYLRATKRARDAELEAKITGDLNDASLAALTGNEKGVVEALQKGMRRLQAYNDIAQTEEQMRQAK